MSHKGHAMSEEFKPIRITLSEEAFDRMEKIMKGAKFRSYSSTIEECIRAIFDIIDEIHVVGGEKDDSTVHTPSDEYLVDSMIRIIMRMRRFTGRTIARTKK